MKAFLDMGGYAPYVWGSYGIAAVVFAWNIVSVRLRRRAVEQELTEGSEEGAAQ